jgi:outer membrane protein assembly factor BamB
LPSALDNGAPLWEGTVALPKGATELDRVADVTSVPVIDGRMICAAAFPGAHFVFRSRQRQPDLVARHLERGRSWRSTAATFTSPTTRVPCMPSTRRAAPELWKQDKLFLRRLTAPLPLRNLVAVGRCARAWCTSSVATMALSRARLKHRRQPDTGSRCS